MRDEPERILLRFSVVLWAATLLMIGLSLPLWYGTGGFPRVPAIAWDVEGASLLQRRFWAGSLVFLGGGSIVFSVLGLTRDEAGNGLDAVRHGVWPTLTFLIWAVLGDVERLQPWIYQFILSLIAIRLVPATDALRFCRRIIPAIYIFSGLSKLDRSFATEIGWNFLSALTDPVGLDPSRWSRPAVLACILAMPAFEILAGVLLLFRRARRVGCVASTLLHLALIGILGPWNLDQSTIVLVWNVAMAIEVWTLFNKEPEESVPSGGWNTLKGLLWFALLAPALEPLGLIDPWPAHALYASHIERVLIDVPTEALGTLPDPARTAARPSDLPGWSRLDLTAWSRAVRGVPVYPGRRANLALAEWVARNVREVGPVRATLLGRANRTTGERRVETLFGHDAIEAKRRSDPVSVRAKLTVPK